ncbi:WbqC family protein [Phycisphaerales bacterium]|nr:WbqC family protein [Phycisphaerales bacterium]RPG15004.1 MAG: hypothetical protein CBB69_010590 [Phycisphaera sp. TMED9]
MKAAILQSSYIPWKGFFDIIRSVDRFIWFDDVQFTIRDWRSRNRIKTSDGLRWLSIPCDGRQSKMIDEVLVTDASWRRRHWEAIERAYGEAPHFEWCRPVLEHLYLGETENRLHILNRKFVETIATELLGIQTEFDESARYPSSNRGQARLLDILAEIGATSYLSGPAARSYIDDAAFANQGVGLEWMRYDGYPEYPQLHGPFEHAVSIIDVLVHVGPDAPGFIHPTEEAGEGPVSADLD